MRLESTVPSSISIFKMENVKNKTVSLNLLFQFPIISHRENGICQPSMEGFVVLELFEQFRIVIQQTRHHPEKCLVVLNPCVLLARVLSSILVGSIIRHPRCDVFRNVPTHPVGIRKKRAKVVVERFEDIAQPFQFWFSLSPACAHRHWADLGVLVSQR